MLEAGLAGIGRILLPSIELEPVRELCRAGGTRCRRLAFMRQVALAFQDGGELTLAWVLALVPRALRRIRVVALLVQTRGFGGGLVEDGCGLTVVVVREAGEVDVLAAFHRAPLVLRCPDGFARGSRIKRVLRVDLDVDLVDANGHVFRLLSADEWTMGALILSRLCLNLEDLGRIGQIIVISGVQERLGLGLPGLRAPELFAFDRWDHVCWHTHTRHH